MYFQSSLTFTSIFYFLLACCTGVVWQVETLPATSSSGGDPPGLLPGNFNLSSTTSSISSYFSSAIVVLTPTNKQFTNATGSIIFTSNTNDDVIQIVVNITGLNSSQSYGLHIHRYGDLSSTDGSAKGPHFDPFNTTHGCPSPSLEQNTNLDQLKRTRHAGDLGNVVADADGNVNDLFQSRLISLTPGTRNYILGRGVVVHGGMDDCSIHPTGNAGARIVKGVIGWRSIGSTSFNTTAATPSPPPPPRSEQGNLTAIVRLKHAQSPGVKGVIKILDSPTLGIVMLGEFRGLVPNSTTTRLSILTLGDITTSTCSNADTLNPFNATTTHTGCFPDPTRKPGDLGNLIVDGNGVAVISSNLPLTDMARFSLVKTDPRSVVGRVMVLIDGGPGDVCNSSISNNDKKTAILVQGVIGITNGSRPFFFFF